MFEDIKKKEAQEEPARFAKIKPVKHTETYELLRTAIQEKRLIELVYNEKRRIVEPHDYGIHKGSESCSPIRSAARAPVNFRTGAGWRSIK
jgi:hypothetical protein